MMTKLLVLTFLMTSLSAWALPEDLLDTHTQDKVLPLLKDKNLSLKDLKDKLSKTNVKVLDDLWDSRKDTFSPGCIEKKGPCQIVSRFEGKNSDHPFIVLPGFTGYRHMNIEQVYDLIQMGYGPVYAMDFRGSGDAMTNSIPFKDYVAKADQATKQNVDKKLSGDDLRDEKLKDTINQLPIGSPDEGNLDVYAEDINWVMNLITKENPGKKFVMNAHSTGAMYLTLALGQDASKAPWLGSVKRVVLESPFYRGLGTDNFIPVPFLIPVTEVLIPILKDFKGGHNPVYASRSAPEFINKAVGSYDPNNSITHSKNRITLTDNIRVWNGHETGGATWNWVKGSIDTHFDIINPSWKVKKLNKRLKNLHQNLKDNNIGLIAVVPQQDTIANAHGTDMMLQRLNSFGGAEIVECKINSKHGLYVESDKIRDTFMAIVQDQMNSEIKEVYNDDGVHEAAHCGKP